MYAFRQRPLTWLFLIALACLNVVAISTDFRQDWYADLLAGQVFIAGGWLALDMRTAWRERAFLQPPSLRRRRPIT